MGNWHNVLRAINMASCKFGFSSPRNKNHRSLTAACSQTCQNTDWRGQRRGSAATNSCPNSDRACPRVASPSRGRGEPRRMRRTTASCRCTKRHSICSSSRHVTSRRGHIGCRPTGDSNSVGFSDYDQHHPAIRDVGYVQREGV